MYRLGKRRGFTLIELLVVIAIIAILAAILFPVFAQARDKARSAACLSNMKQIALGLHMYTQDYDEMLTAAVYVRTPLPNQFWYEVIEPYTKNRDILKCPSDGQKNARATSYGWSYPHMPYRYAGPGETFAPPPNFALAYWQNPADIFIVADSESTKTPAGQNSYYQFVYCPTAGTAHAWTGSTLPQSTAYGNVANWHTGGANLAFMDGHAKFMARDRVYNQSREAQILWAHTNP